MQLHIEYIHGVQIRLCTAFHQQFNRFSYGCQFSIAHSVLKQSSECQPAPATHDRSLLRNETIVEISINFCGKSFNIVNKTVLAL